MQRSRHVRSQQQAHLRRQVRSTDSYRFFNLLTGASLLDTVESLLPEHRERLFPPTETLSMFLAQALSEDRSCQRAVDNAAIQRLLGGLPQCSAHTGGYCRARQRLPMTMVRTLVHRTAAAVDERVPSAWRWHGRPVRAVDGTTASMPDTRTNQAKWPQPHTQRPGLGFPQCRLVGVMCVGSGAVLNAALAPVLGKGTDEQTLFRGIFDTLNQGDVLLGDAFYPTYFLLAELQQRGVDGVFEQYGARRRTTDFRCGKRLGERDHLIRLTKPKYKPEWMDQATYEQAPDSMVVRELAAGGKILVTTLCCATQVPKHEIKDLYKRRWRVELGLRDLKSTLGMEQLSCKSPAMVEKEIWIYLLAYNLIRLSMTEAARTAGCEPRELSFKHAVQSWLAYGRRGRLDSSTDLYPAILALLARPRVGQRNGRMEPRVIKRRPKAYPLLMEPRIAAQARVRQHGHQKKLK